MEFAPVKYEVVEVDTYSPYGGDWAFATFNPKKRKPRMITYYGWDYSDPNQNSRTWVSVDINPIILKYSKIWGVDPLLIEIMIRHESNFNPNAVSPAGALGLMQLMPDTASSLGVSDAFEAEQNIAGGTRYVAGLLERFNSVPLALAAYNAGPGAVLEYGGVPPYAETRYYVDTIYGEYLAGKKARESE
ncbi:lytic transglycosylase domain-containing protein [bacterium]|nr:lytic transglycosylase domain-containing protein [bacterium]